MTLFKAVQENERPTAVDEEMNSLFGDIKRNVRRDYDTLKQWVVNEL